MCLPLYLHLNHHCKYLSSYGTDAAGENPLHADRVQLEVVGDQQAVVPQGVECHLAGPQRLVGEPGQVLQLELIAQICQVQQGGL